MNKLKFNNVGSAAAWLDIVKPNWYRIVDLDKLNMNSATDCILGQVFAEESRSCGYLWALDNFNLSDGVGVGIFAGYRMNWVDEIKSRLKNNVEDKVVAGHYDNVADAARRLDVLKPNWFVTTWVNLSKLNFSKPETSILGMIFSTDKFNSDAKNGYEYGIRILGFSGKAFEGNAQAWEQEIMSRRNPTRVVSRRAESFIAPNNAIKPLWDTSRLDLTIHADGTVTGKLK